MFGKKKEQDLADEAAERYTASRTTLLRDADSRHIGNSKRWSARAYKSWSRRASCSSCPPALPPVRSTV